MRKTSLFILLLPVLIALAAISLSWDHPIPTREAQVKESVTRSLTLLQNSSLVFMRKGGCLSCHHEMFTSMACQIADTKGLHFDPRYRAQRVHMLDSLQKEYASLFHTFSFGSDPLGLGSAYFLLNLYAEKFPPSPITDGLVNFLINSGRPDGSFIPETARPPFSSGVFHPTAVGIHAIRLYAPLTKKTLVDSLTAKTRHWLLTHTPSTHQELVFQLLGLNWCDAAQDDVRAVAEKLKSLQQPDGSWSEVPALPGSAYATGESLYALYECSILHRDDPAFQRGVDFLLRTQGPDGAWVQISRTFPTQTFFNSDFPPYDENQFISAFATSWASLALVNALPDSLSQP